LGIRSAIVKSPQLYGNSHAAHNSQRYKDLSTGVVRGYIVDCATRKYSKSPSICQMGHSIDSVDTFLTPVYESHKRKLNPINESSVSLLDNNGNIAEK
jgi:hypothetical protein